MTQIEAATVSDLERAEGKAELVNGVIVQVMSDGFLPGYVAGEIRANLHEHARRTRSGYAMGGTAAFLVNLPHRQSFSPDAAFYVGKPTRMRFLEGAPAFAVEVRSEHDYGKRADEEIERKRADYFAAGTLVVWDVDLLSDSIVRVYRASDPSSPTVYRRGDRAEAEPAVPGWSVAVDDLTPISI